MRAFVLVVLCLLALVVHRAHASLTASNATLTGSLTAGGGDVVINSSGIAIDAGAGTSNKVRWTGVEGGAEIYGANIGGSAGLILSAPAGGILLSPGGAGDILLDENALTGANNRLGTPVSRWNEFYLTEELFWSSPPTTDFDDYPVVYSTANAKLYRKTDGSNGTLCGGTAGVATIQVERGLVVGATCF